MGESNNVNKKKINNIGLFKEWIIPVISAMVIALLINKFLCFNVYLPKSGSMIPTMNDYDRAVVSKIYNIDNIKRGNIIVFYSEELNETLVKRLIGLPGDNIEITNGVVSVNGIQLEEDYVENKDKYTGTFKVPSEKYFFLGDNRPISNDSRRWKNPYIDSAEFNGKVQCIYYPFKDFGVPT